MLSIFSQPVQSSTGAIPKSISFDKSADKDDESISSTDQKQSVHTRKDRGFFRNWKLPKMGRRGGGRGSKVDEFIRSGDSHRHELQRITLKLKNNSMHIGKSLLVD